MKYEGGQGNTGDGGVEKEMERKLEGAMEQMKILNLDCRRVFKDRKTLFKEVMISKIKKKVG